MSQLEHSACADNEHVHKYLHTPCLADEGRWLVPIPAALGPYCSSDPRSPVPVSQAWSPPIPQTIHSVPWLTKSYRTYLGRDRKKNKEYCNTVKQSEWCIKDAQVNCVHANVHYLDV